MDSKDLHIFADMLKPCSALETMATGDMSFGCDPVPLFEVRHIFPNLDDLSRIFVAKEKGKLDPRCGIFVPLINMDIGAADSSGLYSN
jgi:hypothetical protein